MTVYGGNYSEFDIPLLYLLLRNICSIPEHGKKWGNKPNQTDRTVSANIERIRLIRNDYYGHVKHFATSDQTFKKLGNNLFQIVKELEAYIGSSTVYQDAVTDLKTCSMDPEIEEYFIDKLLVVKELQGKIKTTNKSIKYFFTKLST